MNPDKIIEEYLDKFGKMPPLDVVMGYYNEEYLKLMQKAVKDNKEITPEFLEKYFENKPYDLTIPFDEDKEEDYNV